jgi:macrolide-specific efflux system membrane fusion protein
MPNWKIFAKKYRLPLGLGLLFLLGGASWWMFAGGSADKAAEPSFAEATTGDIAETVTAQGTLEPKEYVNIGAQVSGQLDKLHVEVGQMVSQSQLVAEIDPRVYESRLQEAQAQVKSLQAQLTVQQANLELAKQQHGRNTQLVDAQAISKDAYDTSAAALKTAQAQVRSLAAQIDQAKSTLAEAQTNLGYTKIYAPMAGTIISQTAREGQTLNANQTAPTVVEVANLDTMTVRAQVAEADIGKIIDGMPVTFTTLGSDRVWKTTVRQVIPAPEIVNDVVLYNVLVDVDNTDRALMSGMSTQMVFVVGEAKDAVLIPAGALGKKVKSADDGKSATYVVYIPAGKDKTERKTVTVGLLNRQFAQVTEGLKAGDQVALGGATVTDTDPKSGSTGGKSKAKMGPML